MSRRTGWSSFLAMPRAPNILWIVTTQWRARACGYAGDPNARTPQLDTLVASGANFVEAVTPHPFGPFARAALLTGIPCPANGVRDYFDPLPSGQRTIAHALREMGYATAFFGKWHLASRDPSAPLVGEPHARTIVAEQSRGGFEMWEGFESGFLLNDPWLHGSRLAVPTRFPGYQSDVVCGRAMDWILDRGRAARGRADGREENSPPWFAMVSLEPPHPPYAAPANGVQRLGGEEIDLEPNVPVGGVAEQKAREELPGYYAHIEATDRAIGALVHALDRSDTIVVVTSVHGDMHGAHGLFRKGWPHEESVRVPLIVSLPAALAGECWRGTRRELVSLLDLYRWAIEWGRGHAGAPGQPDRQLISMPGVVALPYQCDRVWSGIRTHARKLIVAPMGPDRPPTPWFYFDLEKDPFELKNLADSPSHAGEIASLLRHCGTAPSAGGFNC